MCEKWNWSFVDHVIYINLKTRPDRDKELREILKTAKIPEEKTTRFEAIETPHCGWLGCAMSHKAAVEIAKENRWKNILILEDDMVFHCDNETIARTHSFFNKLQKINWDVAFLSASYYVINSVDEELFRVKFAYMANSYIVNAHYYDRLIENYAETIRGIEDGSYPYGLDSNWMKLMEKDNWYGIYPCTGYQRPGKSDINHRDIDNKEHFCRHLDEMRRYGSC